MTIGTPDTNAEADVRVAQGQRFGYFGEIYVLCDQQAQFARARLVYSERAAAFELGRIDGAEHIRHAENAPALRNGGTLSLDPAGIGVTARYDDALFFAAQDRRVFQL